MQYWLAIRHRIEELGAGIVVEGRPGTRRAGVNELWRLCALAAGTRCVLAKAIQSLHFALNEPAIVLDQVAAEVEVLVLNY
jgi:hypothetical protein